LAADIVPLAALLCVRPIAVLWNCAGGRCVVLCFALFAACLHVPAVYRKQDLWNSYPPVGERVERLWSWRAAPFLFSARLATRERERLENVANSGR
jgi:hypothetical protein